MLPDWSKSNCLYMASHFFMLFHLLKHLKAQIACDITIYHDHHAVTCVNANTIRVSGHDLIENVYEFCVSDLYIISFQLKLFNLLTLVGLKIGLMSTRGSHLNEGCLLLFCPLWPWALGPVGQISYQMWDHTSQALTQAPTSPTSATTSCSLCPSRTR